MSANALAETLAGVDREGMPELHNRNHIREARNAVCDQHTPFGPLILGGA